LLEPRTTAGVITFHVASSGEAGEVAGVVALHHSSSTVALFLNGLRQPMTVVLQATGRLI